jgi:hypothetical protein
VDVIPYNNRNNGGPAAGLLSLVEVPEKAIVPFIANAFDYVTFKFLTKLSLDALKKRSTLYEIFRFFRFLIKKLLLYFWC